VDRTGTGRAALAFEITAGYRCVALSIYDAVSFGRGCLMTSRHVFAVRRQADAASVFESCEHGSQAPKERLDELPDAQVGTGNPKCAVCAYEAGLQDGMQRTSEAANPTLDA
jgi:hypothetical protein